MIKLIATDMDGTFLDSNKMFDMDFVSLFYRMQEQNIIFVIASGNQFYRLYAKFLPMSESMYFIADNGSFIAHGPDMITCDTMTTDNVSLICQVLDQYPDLFYILSGVKAAYALKKDQIHKDILERYYCNYEFVDSFDDIKDSIMKIAVTDFTDHMQDYSVPLREKIPEEINIVTSGNEWIDLQNKGTDKGAGMTLLQERLNIQPEECMAFGDQMNDYQLLQSVKYSYAMANAVDEIKAIAYGITASNDEQGVLKIIREVVK